MKKYINNFTTESEYMSSVFSLDYPNVNYIQNDDKIIWGRTVPRAKFIYTDINGDRGGTMWDSANTEITQSDFANLNVNVGNVADLIVDSGVTGIGNYALMGYNQSMAYNEMPNVTSIGNQGFVASNGGHADITKFPSLTTLGDKAIALDDFDDIPSTVTSIGSDPININANNYNLKYAESGITIPSGITTTNGRIASNDAFISRIIFESSTPPTDSSNKNYGAREMYVPNGSKSSYESEGFNVNRLYEISGMPSGYSATIEDENGNEIVKVPRMHYFEFDANPNSFLGTDYLNNLFGTTHFHRLNIYHANFFWPGSYKFYDTSYDELYFGDDVEAFNITCNYYPYYTFRAKKIIIDVPNANYRGVTINPFTDAYQGYIEEIEFKDGDWSTNKYYVSDIKDIPSIRRIYFPSNFEIRNPMTDDSSIVFNNLPSLEELTIPSGITAAKIANLTSVSSITLEASTVVASPWNFSNTNNCPIYVPSSIVNDYISHYSGDVDTSRFVGYIDRTTSGTVCENGDLYNATYIERSYDGGSTWNVIKSTKGSLIESGSTQCPCSLNFCGSDVNGNDISINNGSSTLTSYDFSSYGALTNGKVGLLTETIDEYCFEAQQSLSSLTIADSVTYIGHEAFAGCINLTTLTIPSSVTFVGFWAFGMNNVNEVIFEGTTPPKLDSTHPGVFHDCLPTVIYVPDSAVSAYRAIDGSLWTNQSWNSNIIQPISNRI